MTNIARGRLFSKYYFVVFYVFCYKNVSYDLESDIVHLPAGKTVCLERHLFYLALRFVLRPCPWEKIGVSG